MDVRFLVGLVFFSDRFQIYANGRESSCVGEWEGFEREIMIKYRICWVLIFFFNYLRCVFWDVYYK